MVLCVLCVGFDVAEQQKHGYGRAVCSHVLLFLVQISGRSTGGKGVHYLPLHVVILGRISVGATPVGSLSDASREVGKLGNERIVIVAARTGGRGRADGRGGTEHS